MTTTLPLSLEQSQRGHGTLYVWALGVGIVVCGQYFGWNLGLKENGPVSMLVASLIVCLLFLCWVLTLAELSVAMPRAAGPLEYGRRTQGNLLGLVMGWSMLLECQFGAIATAIASGSYVAFLVNPDNPDPAIRFWVGMGTVVVFFFFQAWGFGPQAWIQIFMTLAALVGLVIYWGVAQTSFSWDRAWPSSDLLVGKGWDGVLDAIPYALWWLIIIEGVALAAEEIRSPARSIPRGLVLGMMTIIVMMLLTLGLGCGALHWQKLMVGDFPLANVVRSVLGTSKPILFYGFTSIALFGLIASYHGLFYGASRQAWALGEARFLPAKLGELHATRKTPVAALLASSGVTAAFLIASRYYFTRDDVDVAILVAGLSSLIWYVLAMFCLLILRKREPHLFQHYQAPLRRSLPIIVLIFSLFTIGVYGGIHVQVIPLTVALYAVGLLCYWWQRTRRKGEPLTDLRFGTVDVIEEGAESQSTAPSFPFYYVILERLSGLALLGVLLTIGWITLAALEIDALRLASTTVEIYVVLAMISLAIILISAVSWVHVRACANSPLDPPPTQQTQP